MGLDFDKEAMKNNPTADRKTAVARAWDVLERSMTGNNVSSDSIQSAQWVLDRFYHMDIAQDGPDQSCQPQPSINPPWLPSMAEIKKMKKKGKKKK